MTADGPSSWAMRRHRIDETRVAVDGPGLDRLDGRLADTLRGSTSSTRAARRHVRKAASMLIAIPGVMAPPGLARSRDGVERRRRAHVTTMAGPPYKSMATEAIATRSAPTSFGLS